MKANELRIGNLVKGTNDSIRYPYTISANEMLFFEHDYARFEPIPLTEDWLIKFGYSKDNNGYALKDIYSLSISITKEGKYTPCWNDRIMSGITLQYVHQLQNLYFALTGNEII